MLWESRPKVQLTVKSANVRKFRKFPPFNRPVIDDPAFLVRSYTKIVIKIYEKMVS